MKELTVLSEYWEKMKTHHYLRLNTMGNEFHLTEIFEEEGEEKREKSVCIPFERADSLIRLMNICLNKLIENFIEEAK